LGRFFSHPLGRVVAESFKDPREWEVGGEAMHARKDEVAN
jgi:hypothetical protein